jgi:dihydroorotase
VEILIENGRVIDPKNGIDAVTDLYIAGGRIAALGALPPGFRADRRIDARDTVVCPGLIDLAARLREPGLEYGRSSLRW